MQLHSPFWILLSREISRWNNRLKVVSTSLHKLVAAARSEAAILEEEEALYHAFASDTVPKSWQVGIVRHLITTTTKFEIIYICISVPNMSEPICQEAGTIMFLFSYIVSNSFWEW